MYDVVIIGAGPAGISAALWCQELGLDLLLLEQESTIGGQLSSIHSSIRNYPGAEFANGQELADRLTAEVEKSDFDVWTNAKIDRVDLKAKKIYLGSGEELQCLAIIIATGVRRQTLNIPGEQEFIGRGMIESGARDKSLLAGKDVCVVGGGDAAVENALLLSEYCPTVTLVHRGKKLRARQEFKERLQLNHCITVFTEARVTRILGDKEVEAVEILRKNAIKPFQLAVKGVLIRIGVAPNSQLFASQAQCENGYLVVNGLQETSVPNVFAIGDVANPLAPTIIGAAGSGATAAKVIAARLNGG
jgi:thioredoxin reductase (NADPH)